MFRNTILTAILTLWAVGLIFAADPTAYVINTSGETLSKINLNTDAVTNNILPLGSDIFCYPNQIIIRDTLAFVLLSGTAEIQVVNLKTETTAGWVYLPVGSSPFWMAFYNDQYLYVTLLVDNALAKVDLTTRQVIKTIPIGTAPEGITVFGDRAFIAVTAYDFGTYSFGQGKVAVYDIIADTVLTDNEILTAVNPQFIDIDSQGRLHCVCTGDYFSTRGRAYVIDPIACAVIDSVYLGGDPSLPAISPDDRVYLSAGGWVDDGEVYAYDALTLDIYHDSSNPIYVDSGSMGAVVFQDSTAFVCTFGDRIIRIDASGTAQHSYVMGDGPVHIAFDYKPGDANGDWDANVGDAVSIVNYAFRGGPPPTVPRWRANANGDESINIGDAVYLVNYVFRGGSRPLIGPLWVK